VPKIGKEKPQKVKITAQKSGAMSVLNLRDLKISP
jgi:hypothetical protein